MAGHIPSYEPVGDWNVDLEAYFRVVFGTERFTEIAAALMRPPLATCIRVNTLRTTSESVMRRLPAELTSADAAAVAKAGPMRRIDELPQVIIVPGSGPNLDIDWTLAGNIYSRRMISMFV